MALVYLDHHATTPCDPRVLQAMLPYFTERFGNPASSTHECGRKAADAVSEAREQVAALVGASPGEIIFTGGATEANNLAILGIARGSEKSRKRVVTSAVEHKSVLGPCGELKEDGYDVVILPVNREGSIVLEIAQDVINDQTLLVSIQAANNEVGTIQPINELARLAHDRGALIHCDAAQAVGKISVDVSVLDVDLMSISAHKLYGPKGMGALYLRGGASATSITPLFKGGGQERGLRPGTLNVPGIVGMGEACRLSHDNLTEEALRIGNLRDHFEQKLMGGIDGLGRNGALIHRLPGNSSLTFPDLDAEAMIANVPTVALSTGSACTAGTLEPSHVLLALGLSREEAYSTIRVGLGRFTTKSEIDYACEAIIEAYRTIAPVARHSVARPYRISVNAAWSAF